MGTASTRAAKNERQASPPARIGSLRGRKRAKIRLWRNKAHHTRMMGMQNLPLPHALLRRAYPNDRTVKLAISARAAGNRFATQRMLAQLCMRRAILPFCTFLLPVRGGLAPMSTHGPRRSASQCRKRETCYCRTHSCGGHTRMTGQ